MPSERRLPRHATHDAATRRSACSGSIVGRTSVMGPSSEEVGRLLARRSSGCTCVMMIMSGSTSTRSKRR